MVLWIKNKDNIRRIARSLPVWIISVWKAGNYRVGSFMKPERAGGTPWQ